MEVLHAGEQPGPGRVAVSGPVWVLEGRMLRTADPAGRLGSLEGQVAQEHIGPAEFEGQNWLPNSEKILRAAGDIAVAVVPLRASLRAKCRSQGRKIVARLGDLVLHRIPQLLENMAAGSHCQLPT